MKIGDKITIVPSVTLECARLEELVGRKAEVVEIMYGRTGNVRGAWVCLDGDPYLEEQEWFIPANSMVW